MGELPSSKALAVPIQTFVNHMGSDEDIRDFLDGFPTVSREQVIELLDEVKERLLVAT
uniref:DUF433 domain-containing protein n=1 Tax=Candidatus Kentrum sp. TUN TaxID=2126343 RepID=A0A451A399_9GAMM|nr:MAG: hypothetical protein BECKTUN1418F_GA0071002_101224 [Candidatus Kentron sp. TUN]VFK53284.1 MAG: hypothetical protein BECKTUN1418E_GA0071001_101424 [Candidatus Kentron sp. TUN]VFK60472.1 MAG: hypothetical protein BECKTUN1418D_GA0071000_11246 [Candidatus Kentron sp. TUN]